MLLEKLTPYTLYLGSQSPRRKQLLEGVGFSFTVLPHLQTNEDFPENILDYEVAIYLAKKKAQAYESYINRKKTILITADTIVSISNNILGKPNNREEAIFMLKQLSGNIHFVYTGVCLKTLDKEISFFDKTEVHFRTLTLEEIEYYVTKYQPYDKAGSYGAQEWIGYVGIEKIYGSFFNVMGLPIQKLYVELEKLIA